MATMLERLRAARAQSLTRMTDVLTALSDGDGREPTEAETALLTRERTAVESLDAQIEAEGARQLADARRSGELALATREAPDDGAVPLGGAVITRSEPVYRADRPGPRYFRDLLYAAGKASDQTSARRDAAVERLERAAAYDADEGTRHRRELHTRAGTTAGLSGGAFVPPGYRPDLYVARAVQPPTLWNALNPYPISDAAPFKIPRVKTGTAVAVQAAENDPPGETNLTGETIDVTPATYTGKNTWSRQAIEGSNPAIDMVVADDLQRELNYKLEQLAASVVFATTNSTPITGTGVELLAAMTAEAFALADARTLPPDVFVTGWGEAGQLAAAVDGNGRRLLPPVNPQNAGGQQSDGLRQVWDDMPVLKTAAAPALTTAVLRLSDVAAFGSPVQNFYFVEVAGPESIVLGVWQYAAAVIRQPLGVREIVRTEPAPPLLRGPADAPPLDEPVDEPPADPKPARRR